MSIDKIQENLYEEFCSFENLYKGFLKAKRHKENDLKILRFEYNLEKELFNLRDELKDLTYQPSPAKRLVIYKPTKKEIFIPTFKDRVVQQALLRVIEPIFEKSFIFDS